MVRQGTRLRQLEAEFEARVARELHARLPSVRARTGPDERLQVGRAATDAAQSAAGFVSLVRPIRGPDPTAHDCASSSGASVCASAAPGAEAVRGTCAREGEGAVEPTLLSAAAVDEMRALADEGFVLATRLAGEARSGAGHWPPSAAQYSRQLDSYLHAAAQTAG